MKEGVSEPAPLVLGEKEIAGVAPSITEIIDIVEETLRMEARGKAEVPTKVGVHPDYPRSFLHAMPAWVKGAQALGMKWVSYYPGNSQRQLPDSTALIILNDPENGLPVAIMAGMWITYARTAACVAVAAKYLAPPEVRRIGLVGAGGLARWSLRALSHVFSDLEQVFVVSRTAASRQRFCEEISESSLWKVTPVERVQDAVVDMDIVVSSTPQPPEPPVKGEWWQPGTLAILLDGLSGWDDLAFDKAHRIVTDNYEALAHLPADRPKLRLPDNWDTLAAVVVGEAPPRQDAQEAVMAIPTGIASLDMTVGWNIYRRALSAGIGTHIDLS